jgi:hypothetical protein
MHPTPIRDAVFDSFPGGERAHFVVDSLDGPVDQPWFK